MTTMAEPEWDQSSRDLAMAYAQVDLCVVCGRPTFICQSQELQDDWEVPLPVRCHAETALIARQKGMTEETNPGLRALVWRAQLREGVSVPWPTGP